MSGDLLCDYLQTAKDAACGAARVIEGWRARFEVREKGRADLVTSADLAAQSAIRDAIRRRYPDHQFVAEEEGASKTSPEQSAQPTWIVDPIDGTTNYVHDCPFYCVSIGLQLA